MSESRAFWWLICSRQNPIFSIFFYTFEINQGFYVDLFNKPVNIFSFYILVRNILGFNFNLSMSRYFFSFTIFPNSKEHSAFNTPFSVPISLYVTHDILIWLRMYFICA